MGIGAAIGVGSDWGLRISDWSTLVRICAGRIRSSVVSLDRRAIGDGISAKVVVGSIAKLRRVVRRIVALRRAIWRRTIRIAVAVGTVDWRGLRSIALRGMAWGIIAWRTLDWRSMARWGLGQSTWLDATARRGPISGG